MMAMIAYASTGEIPSFEGNERFIWPTIQAQIDRDIAAYEKRCEKNRANGAKGGRPRKQTDSSETQKTERFSEEPKKANNNDNDKDNDKDNDILMEHDGSKGSAEPTEKKKKSKSFVPPTVEEVREYCETRNNGVDPEMFVNFYSSKGWMIGKNKMTSWKNAVITWERNSKPQPQPVRQSNYHKQSKAEELDEAYKMMAAWGEGG